MPDSNSRIFNIDDHIGLMVCGRLTDGQVVVARARSEAESYRKNFGISISGTTLTTRIANFMQAMTLYGQFRPLGCEIVIASHDEGENYLYKIENSGSFKGYFGCSGGKGHQLAKNYLEKINREKKCEEVLDLISLGIVSAHEEFKEKTYELEISWITKNT